jgi:Polyketide cyclase / dehydrase and lipid transport
MILKILIGVLVVIGLIFVVGATRPADFSVARKIEINATPEKIFPWLNNSKQMNAWMPWIIVDPKMTMTYSGPDEGVGSIASWNSTGQMGIGSATITESIPNKTVKTKLVYTKPFEATQFAEFNMTANGPTTTVEWSVNGQKGLIMRTICMFMNMDKMMNDTFDQGLQKLKTTVETTK